MNYGIPKPTGAKLTANLVATPLDDPTPHQAKSRAQLTQAELETKLKEHKALPEAERIQLRGKCHVCHKHRCHSDFHLKGTTTRASQIKRTPKDDDTTSEESDGYVMAKATTSFALLVLFYKNLSMLRILNSKPCHNHYHVGYINFIYLNQSRFGSEPIECTLLICQES